MSQSNIALHITIKDVSLIDLRKLLYVNLKFGEIFTMWFIFWDGSLVGVNFLTCKPPDVLLDKSWFRFVFGTAQTDHRYRVGHWPHTLLGGRVERFEIVVS